MQPGTQVIVLAYDGAQLRRRVWKDVGQGVLLCTEDDWQQAMQGGNEPLWVGFPKQDVVEVLGDGHEEAYRQEAQPTPA